MSDSELLEMCFKMHILKVGNPYWRLAPALIGSALEGVTRRSSCPALVLARPG